MRRGPPRWVILTGEYPPQPGGVSDYTRLVARGLAAAGDMVQVWAPPVVAPEQADDEVTVHRLPDHFGRGSRAELDRVFKEMPAGTRVFVQYVPHAFGWKAMNLPFCVWLWTRRKRQRIIVMFHEVAYPWVGHGRILRHNFLALVNRVMAGFVAHSARRIYVSIPAWSAPLQPLSGGRVAEWLPVPSTMPLEVSQKRVKALRERLLGWGDGVSAQRIIGHFGTFGSHLAKPLREVVPPLLKAEPAAVLLCVGRGGTEFAEGVAARAPRAGGPYIGCRRVDAAGGGRAPRRVRPARATLPGRHQQPAHQRDGGTDVGSARARHPRAPHRTLLGRKQRRPAGELRRGNARPSPRAAGRRR